MKYVRVAMGRKSQVLHVHQNQLLLIMLMFRGCHLVRMAPPTSMGKCLGIAHHAILLSMVIITLGATLKSVPIAVVNC